MHYFLITLALIALAAMCVYVIRRSIRRLRVFVRSFWPH